MKKVIIILAIIVVFTIGALVLINTNILEDIDKQADNDNNSVMIEQNQEKTETSGFSKTKTGKFYSQFTNGKMYMEYEMEYDGEKTKVTSATSGQKIYSKSSNDQAESISIIDGNTLYMIDHKSKMVIKITVDESSGTINNGILDENDVNMEQLKTGTRNIGGKSYETEEWTVDGATSIMCFEEDDLAYIVSEYEGEEIVVKILKASNIVDDKLFEIPSNYKVTEM